MHLFLDSAYCAKQDNDEISKGARGLQSKGCKTLYIPLFCNG